MEAANTATGGLIGTGLGLLMEGHNDRRQLGQQQELLNQQYNMDERKMKLEQQIGLENWDKTNYAAQVGQLEKAGLNPGLMYGMKGGGGATMGMTGGSVNANAAPKGGGEIMGLQMMNAQRALIEAQTENVQADTKKKGGETEAIDIANSLASDSYETTFDKILAQASILQDEAKMMRNNYEISEATKHMEISMKEGELIGLGLSNEMKEAGIRLTEEQIKQTVEAVKQAWKNLDIQEQNAVINGNRLELDKFIKDVPDSIKLTVETVRNVVNDIVDFKQTKRRGDMEERRQNWNERERTSTQSKRWGKNWSETERRSNH